MRALREESITFNPVKAIQMRRKSARKLSLVVIKYADLFLHFEFVVISPRLYEWPVEMVSIERSKNGRFCLPNMFKELFKQS